MKAIAYTQNGAASVLTDLQLPAPTPGPRDLLVQVQAISVNPVDTKVRSGAAVTEPRVLGWDAVGIVQQVGDQVSLFKVGDSVFYAGAIDRPGSNSELHLVDERIVGHKPQSLDNAHAAALPLTSITAWELLFDRLGVPEGGGEGQSLLIIGAAGGVGSILTQLARKLTKLTVIGTASRDETRQWVTDLGAHHVIDHSQPLVAQLEAIGVGQVDHVASLTHTDKHFEQLIEALRPQGQLALI
ncbi:NADPH:quinone reductase, partial [Pseudomonas putida]